MPLPRFRLSRHESGRNHADEVHAEKYDDAENEYGHGHRLFEISDRYSAALCRST